MAGRLSSYRFRRRLLWGGLLLATAAGTTVISIVFWNTGPLREEHFSGGVAQTYVAPTVVTLTAADRKAVVAVAKRFVQTAVTRDDPGKAFALAGPSMRAGTTRAGWESGEIPVVPFPVDEARWRVEYSYADEVGLEVYAWPEPGAGLRPTLFQVTLVAVGSGESRRWLVEAWVPRGGRPDVLQQRVSGSSPLDVFRQPQQSYTRHASAAWLLALPAALVGIMVAVPAWVILRNRRFSRRAARS